ncbi:MAG: Crp/Fnr family transcriptional regulator [Lachnospiraceae bacterium]|nr:Crp/Fnr family transcriptional regulator [Lachnospiraceae bacterium]
MANVAHLQEADIEKIYLCPLFKGVETAKLASIIKKPYTKVATHEDDTVLFKTGQKMNQLLLVLDGEVGVIGTNLWNKGSIVELLGAGTLYGAEFAVGADKKLGYDICTLENSRVLTIDYVKLLCDSDYRKIAPIISENLLQFAIARTHNLQARIYHLAQGSTREKLLAYLSDQSRQAKNTTFQIDLDRQDLADYLSVERSAMCAELSKMQKDGLINYHKNEFTLKKIKK